MIKQMVLVNIFIRMELPMKVLGRTIFRMDLVKLLGKETWEDGSKYEGNYVEGRKHGKGTYTWNDGSVFTGDWVDNNINGYVI